ncbi:MAG: hypothetical protein ACREA8_05290 [Nitrosotalea sp.]
MEGRTRFQKMIFLLRERANFFKHNYDFVPHNYGPYSRELQNDIDSLIHDGYIIMNLKTVEDGKIKYEYAITGDGSLILQKILSDKELGKKFKFSKIVELAEEIKNEVNGKDLRSVLTDIYREYPDFAKNSQFEF